MKTESEIKERRDELEREISEIRESDNMSEYTKKGFINRNESEIELIYWILS